MAAKTSKDDALDKGGPEESEAAGADATVADETEAVESTAKPAARRKRRVRVIEVLDDEDIDEVLDAMDAEEEAAAEAEAEEEKPAPKAKAAAKTTTAKPAATKAATTKAAATKTVPAKKKPEIIEAEDDEADEEEAEPVRKATADSGSGGSGGGSQDRTIGGVPLIPVIVGVVVIAVLASLAIWQWRSASSSSSKEDDRAEVTKVASQFGDLAANYNASNYQSQMDKAQALMAGDLLDNYKRCTLPNLGNTFKSSPNLSITSKTTGTFVGNVDDRFATAVVAVTIGLNSGQANSQPQSVDGNLIRLSLAKQGGKWKVTQQYASGTNQMSQDCGQSQIPGANGQTPGNGSPSGSPSPTPKPSN
ncbi:hypothetical protein J4573_03790 [Actinomadura barringtoniae]|uniref:Mce-associated membrane protein n=1 Tax=Actinomadura barringtoniae TaxID=1427535 RepID=A0A939T4Q3_9ACTN|nr:hypothetical protein [Actinomadura barringtoniae]MBO2446197.1 hypothetical protein [Actinomadura barringtoniae]